MPDETTVAVPEDLAALLQWFENRVSNDPAKMDSELICTLCGTHLCDVRHGDTMTVLVDVCAGHTCAGGG